MRRHRTRFHPVRASLEDMVGNRYADAVCRARAAITGESVSELKVVASEKVDFLPKVTYQRQLALLASVGKRVAPPFSASRQGATTKMFAKATRTELSPLSGFGIFRIGQDGRSRLISKSEHYHAPLGHSFAGYKLVEKARRLGIPNATHNNTRGHITRLLEEELVRSAAGIAPGDAEALAKLVSSRSSTVLNRVLNLETGSLAVEAAIKMMLARFYKVDSNQPKPKYAGKTPVFVVVGNDDGGLQANYHGTTVLAQAMRGMWPMFLDRLENGDIMLVRAVRPNNLDDVEDVFAKYSRGRYRIAGFLHELIMMNYGALKLTKRFVRRAYALCRKHDAPTCADEIQSCLWSPELFTFREYGIKPTFVALGKGFPGGEYPASRLIFNGTIDCLPQFGALVTNGQEELASLSYLVTMRWAQANADVTKAVGDYYEAGLAALAADYPRHVAATQGQRHMGALSFNTLEAAQAFVRHLNEAGLDISVQTYKADCPPTALTKLPIIAGYKVVDFVLEKMRTALGNMKDV